MDLKEEYRDRLSADITKAQAILNCMMLVVSSGKDLDVLPLTDAALDYMNDAEKVMEEIER